MASTILGEHRRRGSDILPCLPPVALQRQSLRRGAGDLSWRNICAIFRSAIHTRFIFIPGTIGSIAWLWRNQNQIARIKHGLVLVDLGDAGKFTYKKSRRGDTEIDRAVVNVLKHSGSDYQVREFDPYGHDERQYCSPGINLAVGCFSRSPHGEFSEYHTSADNLSFVRPEYLADSFTRCLSVLQLLDNNRRYVNLNPMCEPQLGKRGLYRMMGGTKDGGVEELPLLWVLQSFRR